MMNFVSEITYTFPDSYWDVHNKLVDAIEKEVPTPKKAVYTEIAKLIAGFFTDRSSNDVHDYAKNVHGISLIRAVCIITAKVDSVERKTRNPKLVDPRVEVIVERLTQLFPLSQSSEGSQPASFIIEELVDDPPLYFACKLELIKSKRFVITETIPDDLSSNS
jgi:hypothetical protein